MNTNQVEELIQAHVKSVTFHISTIPHSPSEYNKLYKTLRALPYLRWEGNSYFTILPALRWAEAKVRLKKQLKIVDRAEAQLYIAKVSLENTTTSYDEMTRVSDILPDTSPEEYAEAYLKLRALAKQVTKARIEIKSANADAHEALLYYYRICEENKQNNE